MNQNLMNPNKIIECYFTENIHVAYRLKYSRGEKTETLQAYECYSCHKFHSRKKAFEKHLVNCAQSAGIVYKIDNKSFIIYEDHYQYFGDLPNAVYFDFETSAGSDLLQDKKMYVLSYCIIIAFHPKLDIERIVIFRSFQQYQDLNFDLSHLKDQMLQFVDPVMLNQLKDTCLKVYNKECSFAVSEIFFVELKFTIDLLVKWFHQTYKSRFLEIDALTRQIYEKNNEIDWTKTKCCICDFKLNLDLAQGPHSDEMTYLGFIIRKEHLFLRNLFDKDLLNKFEKAKDLAMYYKNVIRMMVNKFEKAKDLAMYHKNVIRLTNCVRLLCICYAMDSDIEHIDHDCLEYFLIVDLNDEFSSFEEVYEAINEQEIKKAPLNLRNLLA